MATKKTAKKLIVQEAFIDRDGTLYQVGDEYNGRADRVKALMKAEVSSLNWVGRIFLAEK